VSAAAGRLGILGGTFDPVHLGHLALAEEVRETLDLARVLFVPAGDPWQKVGTGVTPGAIRYALVERAIADNPGFAASRLEIDRPGPTYTAETLAGIADAERAAGRDPDLWFILSAEALAGLPTWRDPERVLALARLAVVPRADHAEDLSGALPARPAPRDLRHPDPGSRRRRPVHPLPGARRGRGQDPGVRSLRAQCRARGARTLEEANGDRTQGSRDHAPA